MAKSSRKLVDKKKGGRSAREKQKDFTKRKQKVGKRLLKPQNETITTFKSRAISILEQLAEKSAGATVTKKRYSMNELIARFQQNNPNQKLDACSGVKELLGKLTVDQVRSDLSPLLGALSRCLLSDDPRVRATVIKLIESLTDKVGWISLVPHFNLLGRHLSCALVSLHHDVQASALHLLHMLARIAPDLLHLHANTLVPNLLRLLGTQTKSGNVLQKVFTQSIGGQFSIPSKNKNNNNEKKSKKSSLTSKDKKSGSEMVASTALGSKQNTLVWQLDVLVLLTAMVAQVVKDTRTNAVAVQVSAWQLLLVGAAPGAAIPGELRVPGDGGAADTCARFIMLTDTDKLEDFCNILLPLLHKLWNNILPENTKLRGGVSMSSLSAHCLWCLVDLERILTNMVETCTGRDATQCVWFIELIKRIFSDVIFNHFPFHYVAKSNEAKANKSKNRYDHTPSRSSDDLNVHVATIGIKFGLLNRKKNIVLTDYVQTLISGDKIGSFDMLGVCFLIISFVEFFAPAPLTVTNKTKQMSKNSAVNAKETDEEVLNNLLRVSLECYKTMHPLKKERKMFLTMLLTITDPDHKHVCNLSAVREWSSHLMSELSENSILPVSLVTTVQQLCLRRCPGARLQQQDMLELIAVNLQRNATPDVSESDKRIVLQLIGKYNCNKS